MPEPRPRRVPFRRGAALAALLVLGFSGICGQEAPAQIRPGPSGAGAGVGPGLSRPGAVRPPPAIRRSPAELPLARPRSQRTLHEQLDDSIDRIKGRPRSPTAPRDPGGD